MHKKYKIAVFASGYGSSIGVNSSRGGQTTFSENNTMPVFDPEFEDYADKKAALAAMDGEENRCPHCGMQMEGTRWFAQPGHRYMDLANCSEHGQFLIRVRLSDQADGAVRVSRLTYEATSEAAAAYAKRAEKADPPERTSSQRRRRRRHSKLPPQEMKE